MCLLIIDYDSFAKAVQGSVDDQETRDQVASERD